MILLVMLPVVVKWSIAHFEFNTTVTNVPMQPLQQRSIISSVAISHLGLASACARNSGACLFFVLVLADKLQVTKASSSVLYQSSYWGLIAFRLLVGVFIGYCDYFALVQR